ncbi:MAG: hypothetical protein JJV89_03360 [Desulfosarcina sp.]|nr:hypothetical protein [Desulfobacterales bacterium]
MIAWLKDISISINTDIVEWFTILGVGFVTLFRVGKFSTKIDRDQKDIKTLFYLANKSLLPDDPNNKIIRQSDCTLQNNQLEKLLLAHEDRLKMFIELKTKK